MIHFVTGDIFESGAKALVSPVNCYGVMGKGLALQFKRKFPAYFQRYKKLCEDGDLSLGRINVYPGDGSTYIVSFPTKNHWKDPSISVSIDLGLMALAEAIVAFGVTSIAIPMLGCGEEGLSWPDVRGLIVNRLSHLQDCAVYVYGPMI